MTVHAPSVSRQSHCLHQTFPMVRPLHLCSSGHRGLQCESGRKKKLQACYRLRKETKLHPLIFHFFYCKNEVSPRGRCTNPQGRPRSTDPAFPIYVQRLFLCLIVGKEHNTKLEAKISCDSPDCPGHVMRNYWTEQQKSNCYIQRKEAEKFCFVHGSMKAQHKSKKSVKHGQAQESRDC